MRQLHNLFALLARLFSTLLAQLLSALPVHTSSWPVPDVPESAWCLRRVPVRG